MSVPPEIVEPPATATMTGEPVMDETLIKLSFGNNQNLLKKSMEIFIRDAPSLMSGLNAAILAGDFKQTASLAHALKGLSSYYTQSGPFELANLIDLTAQKSASLEMKEELANLSATLDRAITNLVSAMIERLRGQGGEAP